MYIYFISFHGANGALGRLEVARSLPIETIQDIAEIEAEIWVKCDTNIVVLNYQLLREEYHGCQCSESQVAREKEKAHILDKPVDEPFSAKNGIMLGFNEDHTTPPVEAFNVAEEHFSVQALAEWLNMMVAKLYTP